MCGAKEDRRQVGGEADPGCAGAPSQPPPLPALPDPGEGEGVGGRASHGDVRGEQDSRGPRGYGPVDSFLPSSASPCRKMQCML